MNMTEIRTLKYMPYAQARVVELSDGFKFLKSYDTYVAGITPSGWLVVYGLYSATTRRHLSAFGKEIGVTYQTMKSLFQNQLAMNLNTGECVDYPDEPELQALF